MITEYDEFCCLCGRETQEIHHLVYGLANRKLADADGLLMPLCHDCHEMIHNKREMASFSRITGQLLYERNKCAEGYSTDAARESFRLRYGKSFL